MPTPLKEVSDHELKSIKGICFDIDDTFSSSGKITSQAFSSLWQLHEKKIITVPVTGRPAGWCDHIARFWPVDAIIGENGAFIFYMKDGKRCRLNTLPDNLKNENLLNLSQLAEKIKEEFPSASWASDQMYREFDLAIDICEDVAAWDDKEVEKLLSLCKLEGAHAKLSSVHVNAWYGDYDKMGAFKFWCDNQMPGSRFEINSLDEWIYIGDSPNDEPAFDFFKKSVGVKNIEKYLPSLKKRPTYITEHESGEGFFELAQRLIHLS